MTHYTYNLHLDDDECAVGDYDSYQEALRDANEAFEIKNSEDGQHGHVAGDCLICLCEWVDGERVIIERTVDEVTSNAVSFWQQVGAK